MNTAIDRFANTTTTTTVKRVGYSEHNEREVRWTLLVGIELPVAPKGTVYGNEVPHDGSRNLEEATFIQ